MEQENQKIRSESALMILKTQQLIFKQIMGKALHTYEKAGCFLISCDSQKLILLFDSSQFEAAESQISMILSLKRWPTEPILESAYTLSPISQKVVRSSGILLKQITPITFLEFTLQMGLDKNMQSQNQELFHDYNNRRRKKVQLLQKIRCNLFESKNRQTKLNRSNSTKMLKSITQLSTGTITSKSRSLKRIEFHSREKKKQPFSKTKLKSTNKTEAYLNYYTSPNRKDSKAKLKRKEKHKKYKKNDLLTPQQILNEEYFAQKSIKTQRIDRSTKDDMRDYLMLEISEALNKWVEIDAVQGKQLEEIDELSDKEKSRLRKIHFIEREQLREEIKQLKKKLSYTQHIPC